MRVMKVHKVLRYNCNLVSIEIIIVQQLKSEVINDVINDIFFYSFERLIVRALYRIVANT